VIVHDAQLGVVPQARHQQHGREHERAEHRQRPDPPRRGEEHDAGEQRDGDHPDPGQGP
jgi:hypothetical protein